jgi:outer membrane protein W
MRIRTPVVLVSSLALMTVTLVPSTAAAQGEHNSYIVVKGGPYFPTETNAITAAGNLTLEWPSKYAIDLGLGAYWGFFGLQLSAGYMTTGTTTTTGSNGSGQLNVYAAPILLLARLRVPLSIIGPYLQGGAGVAISTASFDKLFPGATSSTRLDFEAVGGGGCDVYLGPLLLGAEVKYLWLKPNYTVTGASSVGDFTQKLNMSGIVFEGYIGYRW